MTGCALRACRARGVLFKTQHDDASEGAADASGNVIDISFHLQAVACRSLPSGGMQIFVKTLGDFLSKEEPGPRIQLGVARQSFPGFSLPCYTRGLLSHPWDPGSHRSSMRGQ